MGGQAGWVQTGWLLQTDMGMKWYGNGLRNASGFLPQIEAQLLMLLSCY